MPRWSRRLLQLLVVAGFLGAVQVQVAAGRPAASAPPADGYVSAPLPRGVPASAQEVPFLRTRYSRTYRLTNGSFVRSFSPDAINYLDGNGLWQPIDSTLVASSTGGFVEKASSTGVVIPTSLAAPVQVAAGADWVTFGLQGATASATVSGSTATYGSALPGVDVEYQATAEGVKESLILTSATAPGVFSYALKLSPGLTPSIAASGGIDVRSGSGSEAFAASAPVMVDAAGAESSAARFALAPAPGGGYVLTLTLDRAWLDAAARKWPVTVDPTFVTGTQPADCTIASGSQSSTSLCGNLSLQVGNDGSSVYRALAPFSVLLPTGAQLLTATLSAVPLSGGGPEVEVHQQTQTNTGSATWNTYDGVHAWATPGGDFNPSVEATSGLTQSGDYEWDVTRVVRGWWQGTIPNQGLVLKAAGEATQATVQFGAYDDNRADRNPPPTPELNVVYTLDLGLPRQDTFVSKQIDDQVSLHVNVANGNLVVAQHDLGINGTAGHDLSVDRYYNSLDTTNYGFGIGWHAIPRLLVSGSGYTFVDETGHPYSGQIGIGPPAGLDADVTANQDGTYTVTYDQSALKYNFNSSGLLASIVDRNGNKITYTVDAASGAPTSITDTQGRTVTFTSPPTITALHDSTGGRTVSYSDSGSSWTVTDANGGVTVYTYTVVDGQARLSSIKTPRDSTAGAAASTAISYDSSGRVAQLTQTPVSGTTLTTGFTYNSGNTVVTDPRSHQTTYYYDTSSDVVTKTVDPDGHTWQFNYTNASGGSGCGDYNPCSITDPLGNTSTFGWGNVNTHAGENLLWQETPLEDPSHQDSYTYAATSGQNAYLVGQHTDPLYQPGIAGGPHSWMYSYDPNGNLTSKSEGDTAPGQNPVSFTYNSDGTLATATDAKHNQTTYCYDASGTCTGATTHNLTKITPPSPLGPVSITYDPLSRIATITDGNGQTRTYSYDKLDRVTKIVYSGGPTLTFTYDGNGNLTNSTDSTGSYTNQYDALNRLTQETQPGHTIGYGYDPNGNLGSITDASGTTTYTYNNENWLATELEPGASTAISFSYDADGDRTQTAYPNGITEVAQYDKARRVTRIYAEKPLGSGNILTSFSYCYQTPQWGGGCTGFDSPLRNGITSQYPGGNPVSNAYCYDGLGRLTSVYSIQCGNSTPSYQYTYDVNGNMKTKTVNGVTTTYAYNNANELTNSGYAFDANGSETADPGVFSNAAYNTLDQTSSITPTGGSAYNLAYTGLGQARRITNGTISQVNDQLGLNEDVGSATTFFTRDSSGLIIGERQAASHYYFLHDDLGSVVAATDGAGNVVTTYQYDPYGNPTATTGSLYEPIRYANGYWDASTTNHAALYKFGERYYDATAGRWTQVDPFDDPLDQHGWNRYIYAGDDPVNSVDPSGEFASPIQLMLRLGLRHKDPPPGYEPCSKVFCVFEGIITVFGRPHEVEGCYDVYDGRPCGKRIRPRSNGTASGCSPWRL